MTPPTRAPGHLLIYEPRSEGHHPGWLRFITEDLLSAGLRITLAVDLRPAAQAIIRDHLGELISQVTMTSARPAGSGGGWAGRSRIVADCLKQSGAESVFLCALDEIASDCFRRAALGIRPPADLRGRMGGIYHRPRFLGKSGGPMRHLLKRTGYDRITRAGWLRQLLFVDEFIAREQAAQFPGAPIFFLPDPCPPPPSIERDAARRQLGIDPDKRVFLFFGGGYRRKGLPIAVAAMLGLPVESPAFLLCAGKLTPRDETAAGLQQLVQAGRAHLMDRYVTATEAQACFAASDVVLLPYIHHFGTSGVLSQAISAGKLVIVSDEELLGRLTREHGLGLLFPTGDVAALRDRMLEAVAMPEAALAAYSRAAAKYAAAFSRQVYRAALLRSVGVSGVN